MPTQRQLLMHGYYWFIPAAESKPIAEANFDTIIKALTTPLTAEEKNPKQIAKGEYLPVKVTANSYEDAVDEVNRVFNENRWTDGLVIIPPTREAVDWMLTGTSRSPNEYLGTFLCKNGKATIEKVAINAVMAGARPEYLPVIIAAIEAFGDPRMDILHFQASAISFDMTVTVSGPIAEEIGMNSKEYYLSYGNRANSTIGRAARLCLINFGHMWPGINEIGPGRLMCYTGYTFAENNIDSPWQPFHVTQAYDKGFKPEDSCVTVARVQGSWRLTTVSGATTKDKLDSIIATVLKMRNVLSFKYPRRPHFSGYIFGITPDAARDLYDMGYTTQEKLQQYIYDKTSIPYEELTAKEIEGIKTRIEYSIKGEGYLLHADLIHPDDIPMWQAGLKPGGKSPILYSPDANLFIVVGPQQTGKTGELKTLEISQWRHGKSIYTWAANMTKKIYGATLTQAGR